MTGGLDRSLSEEIALDFFPIPTLTFLFDIFAKRLATPPMLIWRTCIEILLSVVWPFLLAGLL